MALVEAKAALASVSRTNWLVGIAGLTIVYFLVRFVYLLYFHPLSRYPGPKLAAITDGWYAYQWLKGRYPWAIEKAFKEYGDVVRIAPNELAFFTIEAQNDIQMSGTKGTATFWKTEFSPTFGKYAGIQAEVDPEKHRAIRKSLAPAFGPRALEQQDPVLHGVIDEFIQKLEELGNDPKGLPMGDWFDWLACDLSGMLAYGHNFNNVRETRFNPFIDTFNRVDLWGTLEQCSKRFPLLYPLIFFALPPKMIRIVPWLLKENQRIVNDRIARRNQLEHPDYLSVLISGDDEHLPDPEYVLAQANHLILGGLDPQTNLYTALLHFLGNSPDRLAKLRDEVRGAFADYSDITPDALQHLPWLNAVIEEGLRMHTNGAFGQPRYSPGASVDGHYVPRGVRVQTSMFAISRSERYFAQPLAFRPERWLPATHADYDGAFDGDRRDAFRPFSMGSRGCIGQSMAYRQSRLLFAKMVWRLDWELVNKGRVDWDRDNKLYAIWKRPPVMMRFTVAEHARGRKLLPSVNEK